MSVNILVYGADKESTDSDKKIKLKLQIFVQPSKSKGIVLQAFFYEERISMEQPFLLKKKSLSKKELKYGMELIMNVERVIPLILTKLGFYSMILQED